MADDFEQFRRVVKCPRAPTLEKNHVERAYIEKKKWAVERIEIYGAMEIAKWSALIRPDFVDDPQPGRAVLYLPFIDMRQSGRDLTTEEPQKVERALYDRAEKQLSRYGLSNTQLAQKEIRRISIPKQEHPQFSRDDAHKTQFAFEGTTDYRTPPENISEREVPEWVLSDEKLRTFIRHVHDMRTERGRKQAARMCWFCFQYWRALTSIEEISCFLGITHSWATHYASQIKEHAQCFFGTEKDWRTRKCCKWFHLPRTRGKGFDALRYADAAD